MSNMTRTNLYLTDPEREQLKAKAEVLGISMAEMIRRILDEYLGKDTKGVSDAV